MLLLQHLIIQALIISSLTWIHTLKRFSSAAAADLRHEACRVPIRCGDMGPNISFPFYIPTMQESYCGYPGFALDCSKGGLTILNLYGNDYVVESIHYSNSSLRVYDAALSRSSDAYLSCPRLLRNMTIPASVFSYASNITQLHLFSNCSSLSEKIDPSSYSVKCNHDSAENINVTQPSLIFYNCSRSTSELANSRPIRSGSFVSGPNSSSITYNGTTRYCLPPLSANASVPDNYMNEWILAMYDNDENLKEARKKCRTTAVRPVEYSRNVSDNIGNVNYNATATLVKIFRSGIELSWTASDCTPCVASGGSCGFDDVSYQFRCFCEDRPHARMCNPRKHKLIRFILATVTPVVVATFIILLLILSFKWKKRKGSLAINSKNMELFFKNHGDSLPKRYKYSQLKKMTNKFKDNLGKGAYGSVYKGTLHDSRLVAVKILDQTKGNGGDFLNEVVCISRTSHVNIVSLLGFCLEGSKRALIYEYMPNGSLDKFMHDSYPTSLSAEESIFNWEKLCEIALGIARGLEYLHQGCNTRILHFDIKPHNILLDNDLRPKISDFGLAKLCPHRASIVSMSGMRGTIGYIAPEVFCRSFGAVSYKSDVYSYGMMMLDMVGERVNGNSRERIDGSSEMYFPHWIYKHLQTNFELEDDDIDDHDDVACRLVKRKLTIVGLWCIQNDPKDRPSMTKVVKMLEGDVESLQVPPKPYLSSPTRQVQDSSASASGVTIDFDEN